MITKVMKLLDIILLQVARIEEFRFLQDNDAL